MKFTVKSENLRGCGGGATLRRAAPAMAVAVGWVLLGSCAGPQYRVVDPLERQTTPEEIAQWRQQQGLTVASEADIEAARSCEGKFVNDLATSPDGRLRVVFRLGKLVGSGGSALSTTSTYLLQDSRGKELALGPSCLTRELLHDGGPLGDQRVWFPPDGRRVVVFEYGNYCHGPEPLTIVFEQDPNDPSGWTSRFLEIPCCGLGPYDEGRHAACTGISGDDLLLNDGSGDGRTTKKPVADFKLRHPFPFSVG